MIDRCPRFAGLALPRLLSVVVLIATAACGSAAAPLPTATSASKDCGSFIAAGAQVAYDVAGLECFWASYAAGTPARWAFRQLTMEGDPIPSTITFDQAQGVVVTRDTTADKYGGANRRVATWRCGSLNKKAWPSDPTHLYLEASGCSGEGKTTSFP
jgi:hypothetical protein